MLGHSTEGLRRAPGYTDQTVAAQLASHAAGDAESLSASVLLNMEDTEQSTEPKARYAIGCMTGTSLDGLDVAVIHARGTGLSISDVRVVGWASRALPCRDILVSLTRDEPVCASDIARAADELGRSHAQACADAWRSTNAQPDRQAHPSVVCVHGQTVFHRPPLSWQLINPWPIASRMHCPVVFDLRNADIAGGGQGAPITPIADWLLLRSTHESRVIANLGGFCNITSLPRSGTPEDVRASDLCACNHVLDHASRRAIGMSYDPDGSHASRGHADPDAVRDLQSKLAEPEAELHKNAALENKPHRSLGTGDESIAWVERWLGRLDPLDLLASACAGVGRQIAEGIHATAPNADLIALAGGSVSNRALVAAISDAARARVVPISAVDASLGLAAPILPEQREPVAFALLGLLLADGIEITMPGVTGRSDHIPLSGAWISHRNIPATRAPPIAGMS